MAARRGPADPHRRERIIAATEAVLREHGIAGLTHRAVAREAGVPLGSTTYYFASLDDLLKAALHRLVERYRAWMHEWGEQVGDASPERLVEGLTDLVHESVAEYRQDLVVEYELCTAAMRRPELRELASSYTRIDVAVLAPLTGLGKAHALSAAMDGLLVSGLTSPAPPSRDQIRTVFAAILTPSE
ncbi:transcriptional regulator, TetR family [Streptoalloteichus tenebrarius]|uniref:Transcriptional regulator, TetR family n=2 Tax=Streptoalloteichus tenebrarius (strain ATCC 17920 / DSM 40477 / JCM 4838 / CBS 697.72 / NBRC 16177 / NCIMB 11028 / NRRL B-12390 / A12253. 1 / ISP 5477) TaxID=1933 RepID=A0ABT1HUN6_STRSD|nr:transcriptional regulator, TetR family [Streptoalloteichus tenebrarius]BFF04311.1 TetR family transcriptional regulator [Streptoalloteichus tenebrarius]